MRRAEPEVYYDGADISAAISDRLLNFSFNDNRQGQADDLEITVHNRDGLWTGAWFPDKGASVRAGLLLRNWNRAGEILRVDFGEFVLDEITAGSDGTFTMRAIAAFCESSFKNRLRCRSWENVSLRDAVASVASENGISLVWNAPSGKAADKIYQRDQSDAAFISERVRSEGLKLKIAGKKITVYEESAGKSGAVIRPRDASSWSFRSKSFGVYGGCEIAYFDPRKNESVKYLYRVPGAKTDRIKSVNRRAESREEAEKAAVAELRNSNSGEVTASVETAGNPDLWSGLEATLKDFGAFDGDYIISSAKHRADASGYRTSVELEKKTEI